MSRLVVLYSAQQPRVCEIYRVEARSTLDPDEPNQELGKVFFFGPVAGSRLARTPQTTALCHSQGIITCRNLSHMSHITCMLSVCFSRIHLHSTWVCQRQSIDKGRPYLTPCMPHLFLLLSCSSSWCVPPHNTAILPYLYLITTSRHHACLPPYPCISLSPRIACPPPLQHGGTAPDVRGPQRCGTARPC